MYCARIVVFILLLLGTAASVCSYFLPLYTCDKEPLQDTKGFYWKFVRNVPLGDGTFQLVVNPRTDFTCKERKLAFIVLAAVSTAGMAFGLCALLFAAAHIPSRRPNGVAAPIFVFCILAIICQVLTVLVSIWPFVKDQCKDPNDKTYSTNSLKSLGFKLKEGFALSVVAAALYVAALFFEFFGCQNIYSFDY